MKNRIGIIVGAVALVLVLTLVNFALAAPGAKTPAAPTAVQPAAVPAPAPAATPVPPHPEIREALDALGRARRHIAEARHDYHGHREDALRATDEAIRQLRICLDFD